VKELKEFTSSNVKKVKYDPTTNKLYVQFLRKTSDDKPEFEYIYKDVQDSEFELIVETESVGSTLRKIIKNKEFEKIELL
jgi:uncharacterized protein YuzE